MHGRQTLTEPFQPPEVLARNREVHARAWAMIQGVIDSDVDRLALLHAAAMQMTTLAMDHPDPVGAVTVADRFAVDGRCNLTYWEFRGLDHGLVDAEGNSRMEETFALREHTGD